jgi:hypothetical protein
MTNMAQRHHYNARRAQVTKPEGVEYELTDPYHRPDMEGKFAGVPVLIRGGKHIVRLTDDQAKFHLDQGSIQLLETGTETA